jgi:hypothetical protein
VILLNLGEVANDFKIVIFNKSVLIFAHFGRQMRFLPPKSPCHCEPGALALCRVKQSPPKR